MTLMFKNGQVNVLTISQQICASISWEEIHQHPRVEAPLYRTDQQLADRFTNVIAEQEPVTLAYVELDPLHQ